MTIFDTVTSYQRMFLPKTKPAKDKESQEYLPELVSCWLILVAIADVAVDLYRAAFDERTQAEGFLKDRLMTFILYILKKTYIQSESLVLHSEIVQQQLGKTGVKDLSCTVYSSTWF